MNILLLPVEVHLDIFKYLNFDQVFSIQQTNSYFRSLIDKYKLTLAKKKFYSLETIVYKSANDKNKYLKLNEEDIGLDDVFELSKELEGKVRELFKRFGLVLGGVLNPGLGPFLNYGLYSTKKGLSETYVHENPRDSKILILWVCSLVVFKI